MSALVNLWFVRTADVCAPEVLRACESLLQPEERARRDALLFERHRHQQLVSRALGRSVLAKHLGVLPGSIQFRRNAHGKPELDPPSFLRFNLSHTTELVLIALSEHGEIGVDCEPLERGDAIARLSTTVFTAREQSRLQSLPSDKRGAYAVRLWTMKEAYMKARGLGLSLPIESLEVDPDPTRERLSFLAGVDDVPSRWIFDVRDIDDHVVSTCVERLNETEIRMVLHTANLATLLGV